MDPGPGSPGVSTAIRSDGEVPSTSAVQEPGSEEVPLRGRGQPRAGVGRRPGCSPRCRSSGWAPRQGEGGRRPPPGPVLFLLSGEGSRQDPRWGAGGRGRVSLEAERGSARGMDAAGAALWAVVVCPACRRNLREVLVLRGQGRNSS